MNSAIVLVCLLSGASARLVSKHNVTANSTTKLDINQKAFVEGQAVLGSGAGQGALNVCMNLADHFVANPNAPEVKVCGTGIKMTVYLLGRCGVGSLTAAKLAHTWTIGSCDTGLAASSCATGGPSSDKRMGASQSYKITQC